MSLIYDKNVDFFKIIWYKYFKNMSLSLLQNIGLSENEAKIYEFLLKSGEVDIATLIKRSNIKRPTVYKILYILRDRGMVSLRDIHKILHVKPESPIKLLELVQSQYDKVADIKTSIQALLPSLTSLYVNSTEKPVVRIYEGVEGIKKIYNDLLDEEKPIYALLQTRDVDDEIFKWLTTKFVKKRVRLKIHAKVIVASGFWAREYQKKDIDEYRTSVMVSHDLFPFQHEVDIYGDKLAFVHYKKGDPLIGVVISHPAIAKTARAWFDLAWLGAMSSK